MRNMTNGRGKGVYICIGMLTKFIDMIDSRPKTLM
jgi:hypothetical protein